MPVTNPPPAPSSSLSDLFTSFGEAFGNAASDVVGSSTGGATNPRDIMRLAAMFLLGLVNAETMSPKAMASVVSYLGLSGDKNITRDELAKAYLAKARSDDAFSQVITNVYFNVLQDQGVDVQKNADGTISVTQGDTTTTIGGGDIVGKSTGAGGGAGGLWAFDATVGGGASAADAAAKRNAEASFNFLLQSYGIPVTSGLSSLIQQGVSKGWSQTTFLFNLRQTDEYENAFPGIFEKDGTLKMDEATYLSMQQQFKTIGALNGINVGDKRVAMLFMNDKSPEEFAQIAEATAMLRDNPALYKQFAIEVQRNGLSNKPLDREHLLKFIVGQAPADWYELWSEAEATYAATQAGLKLGPNAEGYSALGRGAVEKIAGKGLTPADMQAKFEALSQDLLTSLPLSRIQKYGLSKQDLIQARFGGNKQASVLQLMQHIKDQESAFYEQRAQTATFATQGGGVQNLGGATEKAQQ